MSTYQSKFTGAEIDERLEWAEGINPHMEDKDNPHEVTAAQAGALSTTDAGDLAELTTTEKGSLVGAINEVDDHADTNATSIGTLASLTTTEKTNLVGAINEVDADVGTNATAIGTLASLTTTEKTNLVGAINELDTDKVETSAITNTLTETAAGKVLDARQGKTLSDKIGTQTYTEQNYIADGESATSSINKLDMQLKDTADLVSTNVGDLETLTTTDKSSLVNATNEVKNLVDINKAESTLKVATVEKELNALQSTLSQANVNQEAKQTATGYGIVSLPKNAANGQVSAILKGNTWTNRADIGDTSPQTIENLDSAKTYLLIKTDGGTVNVDAVDTAVPAKITGKTSTVLTWASGKIALYELSTAEAALTEAQLGARYHYVSGTKSTISAGRLKAVGENIWGSKKAADDIVKMINNANYAYLSQKDGRNVITLVGHIALFNKVIFNKFKPNTQYTISVHARAEESGARGGYFVIEYTDGTSTQVYTTSASWTELKVTSTNGKSIQQLSLGYGSVGAISYFDYDTLQIEEGSSATPYEPYKESISYINGAGELRSLPNGPYDEIRVSENKLIKRIGDKTNVASGTVIDYSDMTTGGQFVAYASDGTSQVGVKGDTLTITATTLTYQLATPIEIPIQTSGSLVSYPSGTVYIEPYVADAGIYTDKMEVLYSDLPIKALEKISKVDFDTGLETELDITAAVIAEDKLSFTHPDLTSGDIVFFVYEHGAEGTIPETEISYYDSRYVIKGEDDKFYQWEIEAKLVGGVITPSIKLVEV